MLILSRVISTALASALCVALAACPEAPEATTDTADVSADAAVACDPAAPSLGVDQLFERYFSGAPSDGAGCVFSGCHLSGGLVFTTAAEFRSAVVGVGATSVPGKNLVEPGDPGASALLDRLRGVAALSRMPVGGPYLSEVQLAEVAAWICAGAPESGCLTSCEAGACGLVADGCGGTVDCGGCGDPGASCGGGGEVNVCGCTPTSCAARNVACGIIDDGCGSPLDCGTCAATAGVRWRRRGRAVRLRSLGMCRPGRGVWGRR